MKLKQLLVAALLTVSAGASAQTDVTSTYLTNADFSQGTPVTVGVCTYAKDKTSNGTEYANLVAVDGWTAVSSADGKAGGLFAIGGGAWLGGTGFTAPATDSDGNTGVNVLGIVTCWSASVQYTQDLKAALPAGTYTLVLAAYNSGAGQNEVAANLIGFKEAGGTTHYATTKKYTSNTWKYEFITFTLSAETSGQVSIGYTSTNTGSGNMPHLFVSGLQLFEGEVDAEAYEAAKTAAREAKEAKVFWDNAVAAANAALADAAYNHVIGSERGAVETELAKAEPTTKDAYNEATAALNTATDAFKASKVAYDLFAALPDLEYADAAKKPIISAESTAAALTTAMRAYYESNAKAEGVTGAVDYTSSITNANNPTNNDGWTWSGNKNNPASNEPWTDADGNNTHSYFDGGNWGASSWTTTMKQTLTIPAGKYLLTAKGRAALNTTMTMAVGEVSVELPHVGSTGNYFDRGWGDAALVFETKGRGDDEILVTATSSTVHEWFSISDFRLVQLEDHAAAVANENLTYALAQATAAPAEVSTLLTQIAKAADPTAADVTYQTVVTGSEATALAAAVTSAQAVDATDVAAVLAATDALTAATNAYNAAKPAYERAFLVVALAKVAKQLTGVGDETVAQITAAMQTELANTSNTAAAVAEKANEQIKFLMNQAVVYQTKVMGFDVDEYAPYTNVAGLQLVEAAKAVGTNPAASSNEDIYTQAVALSNVTWAQNTVAMEPIFDGQFATTAANATSGDINLPGWTKVEGIRLLVKDEATDPGLAYTDGKAAVFSWGSTTLTYGEQTGYTLPLNKHSLYELTLKVSAWRDGEYPSIVTVALDGVSQSVNNPAVLPINTTEGNPFATLKFFVTPTEDNSVLTIYGNRHFTIADLSLTEVPESNVTMAVSEAKWATFIAPFDVVIPAGVTASKVTAVADNVLTLEAVEGTIPANTPVVLNSESTVNETVSGQAQAKEDSYTVGLLTGVYTDTPAVAGTYVLQNQSNVVGFYQVETAGITTVKANRAYLTAPSSGVKAFFLGGGEDAIQSVFDGVTAGEIYNVAGQRINKLQRGVNIVNGKKVVIK